MILSVSISHTTLVAKSPILNSGFLVKFIYILVRAVPEPVLFQEASQRFVDAFKYNLPITLFRIGGNFRQTCGDRGFIPFSIWTELNMPPLNVFDTGIKQIALFILHRE